MTPSNKIRYAVLKHLYDNQDVYEGLDKVMPALPETDAEIEVYYTALRDPDSDFCDGMRDFESEIRSGDVEANGIEPESSRHYESRAVAKKMHDGSWVGWTYWYGGGKHGDPDNYGDWIEEAYDLDCKEEEQTVIVRKFKLKRSKNES